MVEQNERLAVMEMKLQSLEKKLDQINGMHLTLDALLRQARNHSELIDSEAFTRDRIWLRETRKSAEQLSSRIKTTAITTLTGGVLLGLWQLIQWRYHGDH